MWGSQVNSTQPILKEATVGRDLDTVRSGTQLLGNTQGEQSLTIQRPERHERQNLEMLRKTIQETFLKIICQCLCHRVPEASSPAHHPGAGSAGLTSRAEVTLSRSQGSGQARPEADGGSAMASISSSASNQTREGLGWAPDLAARSHSPSNSNASFLREATLQSPRV